GRDASRPGDVLPDCLEHGVRRTRLQNHRDLPELPSAGKLGNRERLLHKTSRVPRADTAQHHITSPLPTFVLGSALPGADQHVLGIRLRHFDAWKDHLETGDPLVDATLVHGTREQQLAGCPVAQDDLAPRVAIDFRDYVAERLAPELQVTVAPGDDELRLDLPDGTEVPF